MFKKEELEEILWCIDNSSCQVGKLALRDSIKEKIQKKLSKYPIKEKEEVKKQFVELIGEVTHINSITNRVKDHIFKIKFKEEEYKNISRVKIYNNNYAYYNVDKKVFKKKEDLPKVGDKVLVRSNINAFFGPFAGSNWNEDDIILKIIEEPKCGRNPKECNLSVSCDKCLLNDKYYIKI